MYTQLKTKTEKSNELKVSESKRDEDQKLDKTNVQTNTSDKVLGNTKDNKSEEKTSKGNSKKAKNILIVEDETALSKALNLKLTKAGYSVTVASNGEDGLKTIEDGKIDLALLDLLLPKMNGFEVLEKLQESGNKTPVIVVSNLSQEEDIERIKKLGAKKFFVKSNIQINEIVEYIKKNYS